jgi:hypothetical protein
MIVERDDDERLRDPPKPKRSQMMKIAGAVKQKWRKLGFMFAIKLLDQTNGSGKTKAPSPFSRIQGRELERRVPPRAIKIDMQTAGQKKLLRSSRTKTTFARFRQTEIFCGRFAARVEPQSFLVLHNGLGDPALTRENITQIDVNIGAIRL